MEDLVRSKREQILRVAQRHGVTAVRVFGSMARGDAGPTSDVDLLVDVGPRRAAQRPCASRGRASVKDDRVYLSHVLRCIARIEGYTAGGRNAFFASHLNSRRRDPQPADMG